MSGRKLKTDQLKIGSVSEALPSNGDQKRTVGNLDQPIAFCDQPEAKLRSYQVEGQRLMEATLRHLVNNRERDCALEGAA